VSLLAVLLVGLIAGLLVGTAIDHHRLRVLDAAAWTLARQSIDAVFSKLLPWWWNITLLLLLFAAYLNQGRTLWLFLSAGVIAKGGGEGNRFWQLYILAVACGGTNEHGPFYRTSDPCCLTQ